MSLGYIVELCVCVCVCVCLCSVLAATWRCSKDSVLWIGQPDLGGCVSENVARLTRAYHRLFDQVTPYLLTELSMGWVDPSVGLGWVHYSKSTKNLKGLF